MNILYLAHRIPFPPNKGDKIRSFHEIRFLSRRHKIYLACFVDEKEDFRHVDRLGEYCEEVKAVFLDRKTALVRNIGSVCFGNPLSIASYRSAEMSRSVREILEKRKIDLALVFSSSMAQYVIEETRIRTVMDFVDVDSFKWRQYSERSGFPLSFIYRMESERLSRYEDRVARTVESSILVTEAERDTLAARTSGIRLAVVRNGVDTEYFRRAEGTGNGSVGNGGGSQRLAFVGAMDYLPNIDAVLYFVSDILPRIRERYPEVEFDVVGRNPTEEIRDLQKRDPRLLVHGTVPDVRPFLERATVAVAPMRIARGVQNKILEAMSMGTPVVVSRDASKGIEATHGRHILVAESPMDFAESVMELLADPKRRATISREARKQVENRYSWESAMSELENLLEASRAEISRLGSGAFAE